MLDAGVIRESCSPWAAPIVLVQKKGSGAWRFCVDYRKLNHVTTKDAFPLPRIEDSLTSLHQAQWYSTLDLASGYWQVKVEEQDRAKTAFTTPFGLFEFERMPFGLCNAPATFQRLMQRCMGEQLATLALVYLDDVILYSVDFDSHLQHPVPAAVRPKAPPRKMPSVSAGGEVPWPHCQRKRGSSRPR